MCRPTTTIESMMSEQSDSNSACKKRSIAGLIPWSCELPAYVFVPSGYRKTYFFETPLRARFDELREWLRLVDRAFGNEIIISAGYDSAGHFSDVDTARSIWRVDGKAFSQTDEYFAKMASTLDSSRDVGSHLVATDDARDWIPFENPAEAVGVIDSKRDLSEFSPDSEAIFDIDRFENMARSSMNLVPSIIDAILKNYRLDD